MPDSGKGKADAIDCHVGARLKERRILLGMSQSDIAAALNVSLQQIQKYEKATNRIASGKLYRLAQFLHVPIGYFYENSANSDVGLKGSEGEFTNSASTYINHDISEKEQVSLMRAYDGIKDPGVRKRVLEMVKSLSSVT